MKKIGLLLMLILLCTIPSLAQEVGETAPEFSAQNLKGKTYKLSNYRGKVVLLKFWASWCGPCIRSLPKSKKLDAKYRKDGLVIFCVSLSRNKKSDAAYLAKNGYKFPVMVYKGGWKTGAYEAKGIPYEVLIGRDGKILWKGNWGLPISLIKKALKQNNLINKKNKTNSPSSIIRNGFSKLSIERLDKKNPYFRLTDLNGKTYTSSSLKGKIVFLNFWATWCPPCRREMPGMQKLYKAMKGEKFVMLTVSAETKKSLRKFMKQSGYKFPTVSHKKLYQKYGVRGIPSTFIINKKGIIIGNAIGSRHWDSPASISLFKALAQAK